MTTYVQLKEEIVELMKSKDKVKLNVLRLVASKVEKIGDKTDEGVLSAIKSELKEMNQTLESLEAQEVNQAQADARAAAISEKVGMKVDAVNQEEGKLSNVEAQKAKIAFLETFLPAQLTEDEVKTMVQKAVADDATNIGLAMKSVKAQIAETSKDVNMKMVSDLVRASVQTAKLFN